MSIEKLSALLAIGLTLLVAGWLCREGARDLVFGAFGYIP